MLKVPYKKYLFHMLATDVYTILYYFINNLQKKMRKSHITINLFN